MHIKVIVSLAHLFRDWSKEELFTLQLSFVFKITFDKCITMYMSNIGKYHETLNQQKRYNLI